MTESHTKPEGFRDEFFTEEDELFHAEPVPDEGAEAAVAAEDRGPVPHEVTDEFLGPGEDLVGGQEDQVKVLDVDQSEALDVSQVGDPGVDREREQAVGQQPVHADVPGEGGVPEPRVGGDGHDDHVVQREGGLPAVHPPVEVGGANSEVQRNGSPQNQVSMRRSSRLKEKREKMLSIPDNSRIYRGRGRGNRRGNR